MAKIFDLAAFKSPKFSVFDHSHSNILSYGIGEVIPVCYIDMSPNDRARININEFTRFAAMLAPSFDNYEITIDGHFVPYRLLPNFTEQASPSLYLSDQPSEKFFNFTENANNLQTIKRVSWHELYSYAYSSADKIEGSLYDFLGYPTMSGFRERVRKFLNSEMFLYHHNSAARLDSVGMFNWLSLPVYYKDYDKLVSGSYVMLPANIHADADNVESLLGYDFSDGHFELEDDASAFSSAVTFEDVNGHPYNLTNNSGGLTPFYFWLADNYNIIPNGVYAQGESVNIPIDWDKMIADKNLRMDSLIEEYIDYATSTLITLGTYYDTAIEGNRMLYLCFYKKQYNLIPLSVYWRIIADWYANSNLDGDSEEVFSAHCDLDELGTCDWKPWHRRWASDYFTSAFDSPQVGQAQRIPVNGTIPDLRANNRLQQIFERAKYAGKRYIEQVAAFFGAKSSNARYDRTEVLFRETFTVSPEAVTQTSQEALSAVNSPLGSLAGNAAALSHHSCCDYTCEEHGMLMVLLSVRPKATYMQGVSKFLEKYKMTDFLIPQFSNLGEQEIMNSEIYMDYLGAGEDGENLDDVFGYQRRYAEYMFMNNEVHNSMRSSMDYWHSAREFEYQPALEDAIAVDAVRDGLNRVFAVQSRENIYTKLWFDIKVVRALPRMIDYSL